MWPQCYSTDGLLWWSSSSSSGSSSVNTSVNALAIERERLHQPLTGTREYYLDVFSDDVDTSPSPSSSSLVSSATSSMMSNSNSTVAAPVVLISSTDNSDHKRNGASSSSSSSSSMTTTTPRSARRGRGARGGRGRRRGRGRGHDQTVTVTSTTTTIDASLPRPSIDNNNNVNDEVLEGDAALTALRRHYRRLSRSAIKSKSVPKTISRSPASRRRSTSSTLVPNSIASPVLRPLSTPSSEAIARAPVALPPVPSLPPATTLNKTTKGPRRSRHRLMLDDDEDTKVGSTTRRCFQ
jgi:hypothetical protein